MQERTSNPYIFYLLQLADNAVINGHRISEWCGHGPVLEQDIALINTALDHIGQARNFYQYAASLINQLPATAQEQLFNSRFIAQKLKLGETITEDDLAYHRDAWDYKNVLLVEQENIDWAYTVVRSFFIDVYNCLLFEKLKNSEDEQLAAIAEKSLKECLYHKKWSSEWVIRLGDGTAESHEKIAKALQERWAYSGELFMDAEADIFASQCGGILPSTLQAAWKEEVAAILEEATLTIPDANAWMQRGGKIGTHSEHLGYILADMQFLQRAYPGATW